MKRVVLLLVSLSSFLVSSTLSSVSVALPSIGREFTVESVTLNWIMMSFLVASTMTLMPFGKLADIKGRRKIFIMGVGVFTLASMIIGLSNSVDLIIAFRFVQGIGGAMIFATSVAILTSVFPLRERGRALGIHLASVYTGTTAGPLLGGVLTEALGWRAVFLFNVPLGVFVMATALCKVRMEWAEAARERLDVMGSMIYGAMMLSMIIGISELSATLISAGLILMAIFIVWESRARHPVLELRLFRRNIVFAFSSLAALLNYAATYAVIYLLSLYLQYVKGVSPQQAGIILVAQPVVQALLSPLAGWLSDRVEPRIIASAGMGVTAISLMALSTISSSTEVSDVVVKLVLLGLGLALFVSPNTNAIMSSVENRLYGIASATTSLMRNVGQAISMAVVTLLFTMYFGGTIITPEVHSPFIDSIRAAFTLFSLLCIAGIFASLARGRVRAQ